MTRCELSYAGAMARREERFVTIRRVSDPVEAEMLKHLLEQEGIAATIQGNAHAAMLGGLGSAVLDVPLQVLESDAERARAVIDALHDYDSVDASDTVTAPDQSEMTAGAGPYRGAALEEPVPDRKIMVAIAAALIIPLVIAIFGAGHFYARSHARGFMLLASGWGLVLLGFGGRPWAFFLLPVVMLLDAVGASLVIHGRQSR